MVTIKMHGLKSVYTNRRDGRTATIIKGTRGRWIVENGRTGNRSDVSSRASALGIVSALLGLA